MNILALETPHGRANAHLRVAKEPRAALVLGHGAGGGIAAPDLVAVAAVATSHRITVVLVEQPYRVAGRRSPPPARHLDVAWIAIVAALRASALVSLPIIVGGRSSGARVACRTARATGASGVLCLAFPLCPPPRAGATPGESRLTELDAVQVPMLVIQGVRDRFGMPPARKGRTVVRVFADHALRTDLSSTAAAVGDWLELLVDM